MPWIETNDDININNATEVKNTLKKEIENEGHRLIRFSKEGKVAYAAVQNDDKISAYIYCLDKNNEKFRFKKISEDSHPLINYFFHCSPQVLDALTPTTDENALKWRESCRKKIEEKRLLNKPFGVLKIKNFKLSNGVTYDYVMLNKTGKKTLFAFNTDENNFIKDTAPISATVLNIQKKGYDLTPIKNKEAYNTQICKEENMRSFFDKIYSNDFTDTTNQLNALKNHLTALDIVNREKKDHPGTVYMPTFLNIAAEMLNKTQQQTEDWHTKDIPIKGLPVVDGEPVSNVIHRIVEDAVSSISSTQKIGNEPLYAYLLPSTKNEHGRVRFVPDDQKLPDSWRLIWSEKIRPGMVIIDKLKEKLHEMLRNQPVLAFGEPDKKEEEKMSVENELQKLKSFMSSSQLSALKSGLKGEEKSFFVEKIKEYADRVNTMPKTYEQDGLGKNSVSHLHYFVGSFDFYITEKDMVEDEQYQAFGYVINSAYPDGAEFGYISIEEITNAGAELDLYWEPKTIDEIIEENDNSPR
jgi:hypothetical protein